MTVRPEARRHAAERGLPRRRLAELLVLLLLLVGVAGYLTRPSAAATALGIAHDVYQLDESTTVETWSVPLPFGYRLVRWRSDPPAPQDGLRLFGKEQ